VVDVAKTPGFTVLMPVYGGDNAAFARAAFDSVTTAQQLRPDNAVIVVDGPVGDDIEVWLAEVGDRPDVTVVRIAKNAGLANALNVGLAQVTTPLVARMDADDISLPQRFALQIPMFDQGYDVVGGAIAEFVDDPDKRLAVRSVYTVPADIESHARLASPLHHPSVVFRKDAVVESGGYPQLAQMEDYLLWARMLMRGCKIGNVADVLLCYRVGHGAYSRRGGGAMARSEAQLQREFLAMGFTSRRQYLRNKVVRGSVYRLMPTTLRRAAYSVWTRVRATRHRDGQP